MPKKIIIDALDTHTEGEPTRIIIGGLEQFRFSRGSVEEKRRQFAKKYDWIRKFLLLEPRGHNDMFGAVPVAPKHRDADLGVFFMDNKGYLDMCGHGTMGVVTAFIENGGLPFKSSIKIETPAGFVKARPKIVRDQVKHVTVQNVDSFVVDKVEINFDAEHKKISIPVDVVYSGNLFGLVNVQNFEFDVPVTPNNVGKFINYGLQIREKINEKRFTNPFTKRTEKVGLIEFYQPNENKPDKNVVIFGDGAVDRSPCGTGTCAKMTLLFNKGELEVGDTYTYESIIGTSFKGRIVDAKKKKGLTIITPEVTGSAYIVARHSFVHQPEDPLTGFQLPHHIQ